MRHSLPALLLMSAIATISHAAVLLGTDLPAGSSALTVGFCCSLSQPFTLTTGVTVSSIALQVAGTGVDPSTIWLTDRVGPAAGPSDVLFETTETSPDNGGTTLGETITLPVTLTLSPGNYFLVMNSQTLAVSSPGPRPGWLLSFSTLSSSVGRVGPLGTSEISGSPDFIPAGVRFCAREFWADSCFVGYFGFSDLRSRDPRTSFSVRISKGTSETVD